MLLQRIDCENPSCADKDLYKPFANEEDSDCASFYICLSKSSHAILIECPEELEFSAERRSCTWPAEAKCSRSICKAENQKVEHPDSNNEECNIYQLCDDQLHPEGKHSCGSSEIFNPAINECVDNDKWYCDKTRGPDCTKSVYSGKKLAVFNDCSAYYECKDGIRLKLTCDPATQHFDSTSGNCIPKSQSTCGDNNKNPFDVHSLCKGNARKYIRDPLHCRGYYYCFDDHTPYWNYCNDYPYIYFNDGSCVKKRPTSCRCEDVAYTFESETVYVKSAIKSKFYVCKKGEQPILKSCPRGFVFDETQHSCMKS